jgi:pimeloyl-ACP methyl ester carboxylesterase
VDNVDNAREVAARDAASRETVLPTHRSLLVHRIIRITSALVVLALITQAGVFVLQHVHPQQGKTIDVAGACLNVVDLGPRDAAGPPVVLIHGASSNLQSMQPLGDLLAKHHRVISIDRPGHGWSTRDDLKNSTPAMQARMIDAALEKLEVSGAIMVVHSLAGAVGALLALDYPRVAGLAMLAPVAYPWPGGVGWYNKVVTTPIIGPLLAYTITLPLGLILSEPGARSVFAPQTMPAGFVRDSATPLLLRPREFLANAWDLVTLKAAVAEQAPRYGNIKAPVVVITGDTDSTVSANIHSRRLATAVPNAKLIMLPGVGHMVQYAAPDVVVREVEGMIAKLRAAPKAELIAVIPGRPPFAGEPGIQR